MAAVYLIDALQKPFQALTGRPRAEQVQPILEELFQKTGVPSQAVQEIHWVGGDEEFWLASVARDNTALARFQWPPAPLLAHYLLQSCARSVETGGCDLILLAQESSGQALLLLLASQSAVDQHHLSPRLRLARSFTVNSAADGLASAAAAALSGAGLQAGEVQCLAASQRLNGQVPVEQTFPAARWVRPEAGGPAADLFTLAALLGCLAERQDQRGLLLSEGPQKAGLVTLFEKV